MFQWSVVKLYLSVREGIKEASEADRMSFPVWRAVAAVLYDGLLLELRYGKKLKSLSSAALSDTWQESKGHFCINLEVGKVIDKFTEKETDQPRIIR